MAGTETHLERELGLWDVVLFGVGGIVGAGIYAIIGEAAGYGGNLLWVSFLIAAAVAFLTAATYAEMVSRFPDAGGSFEYVRQAFGLRVATVSSLAMLFTGVVAAGAIAISFSSYLSRLLDVPMILTTIAVVVLMGLVNVAGAAEASWFNTLATVVTLAGLAAVVVVSFGDIGSVDLLSAEDTGLLALGLGSALIFFSFIGFEDLVKLAEETEDARSTLPKGIMISAVIVLVVYLFVAVAAASALGPDELANSEGPLAAIMESKAGAAWGSAIVIVALFATSKTILSNILGASRLIFDVSRDTGFRPIQKLSRVNDSTDTPVLAIVIVTVLAAGFGAIGNLEVVASMSNVLIMLVFLMVNASLLKIRAESDDKPPFLIPLSIGRYPASAIVAIAGISILLVLNLVALFGGATS
jgi:APA family basic amino acid/polyamine antiporter